MCKNKKYKNLLSLLAFTPMIKRVQTAALFLMLGLGGVIHTAEAATSVTTTGSNQTMVPSQTAVVIDSGIAVVNDAGNITDGRVLIASGFVSGNDTLSWNTTLASSFGISGSFSTTTGVLTFTGTTTPANWQALFRTVAIATTSSSATTRSVSFTIGSAIPFSGNGHFYEFVTSAGISWTAADTAADARTLFGLQGYLVTVTSAEENSFVISKLAGEGWMGASDAATENDWKWVTGPETGTSFFAQSGNGGASVGGYYNNWASGEPNNSGDEDYAHFLSTGKWNDYPHSLGSIAGYVVEYGGMAGDPSVTLTASRNVSVQYNVTPSTGAGGSISPNTVQTVNPSATPAFTLTADANYSINSVGGTCGGSLLSSTYTVTAVTTNCTVVASFAIDTYTLTYTAGANGSISGSSPQTINHGSDGSAVSAVAATGYHFVNWSDNVTANPRTDSNITANVSVSANFAVNIYTVTATAGTGGSVTSTGGQSVNEGASISFTVTAGVDTPYAVAGGTCPADGWNGNRSLYTTGAISADCSVSFAFYSQMTVSDANGNPPTGGTIASGTTQTFTIDAPGTVSIGTVLTRGGTASTLDANGIAAVITDNGDGTYTFLPAQTGVYDFTFTDATSGQTVTLSYTVHAQASFASLRQSGTNGETVNVRILLNDVPVAYPVTIPYSVQGDNLSDDLSVTGSVTINDPAQSATMSFTPNSTTGEIVLTLATSGLVNAELGGLVTHTVVLQELIAIPIKATLSIAQGAGTDTLVTQSGGNIALTATPAGGGSYSYDWSGSSVDLGIHTGTSGTVNIDPSLLDGSHRVQVVVTETASPYRSTTLSFDLRVAGTVPTSYSDYYNATYLSAPHRLAICPTGGSVTGCLNGAALTYLETMPGYTIKLGQLSERASWLRSTYGSAINASDIIDTSGFQATNAEDTAYMHLGYEVDFELSGLQQPGETVAMVIPLSAGEAIPTNAVWRKYQSDPGWVTFQADAANSVYSAPRNDAGSCPWSGDNDWVKGLNAGHECVRLSLQDGGPNDSDGRADGVIRDPGSLAIPAGSLRLTSGGSFDGLSLILGGLLLLLGRCRSMLAVLLVLPLTAVADNNWYIGGQWGQVNGGADTNEVNARLANAGISATAQVDDITRNGWRIFGGHKFTQLLAIEGGVTELGDIITNLTAGTATLNQLEEIGPASGKGLELSGLASYPINEWISGYARLGLWHWEASYELSGIGSGSTTKQGSDILFGFGVEARFYSVWSARLSWDRYRLDGEDHDFIGLAAAYHFEGR